MDGTMTRIADVDMLNGTTILFLDTDIPDASWNRLVIDGKKYEPIPVYDIEKTVAVKGGNFSKGQEVRFIYER